MTLARNHATELSQMLADHTTLIDTDGEEGQRFDINNHSQQKTTFSFEKRQGLHLPYADLRGADTINCELFDCDFKMASFRDGDWLSTKFDGSDFRHASFEDAVFDKCSFRDCDLRGVNLTDVIFHRCDFTGATLDPGVYQERWTK